MKYDPKNSTLSIFTEREGALSPVGHDLHLEVTKFEINVGEDDSVDGFADVSSLRVLGSRVSGKTEPMAARDSKKIEAKIQKEVFPKTQNITLSGDVTQIQVSYDGHTVTAGVNDRMTSLDMTDLGLKPVTAFFGALRVKEVVRIELNQSE